MKRPIAGIVLLGVAIPASAEPLDAVVAKVMPTIISIRAESAWGGVVSGTGFIIEETGIVATNLRLVEGAERVVIKLQSGEAYDRAKVASFDKQRDLVLLQFPGFGLSTVKFAEREVAIGQTVFAVGNSLGLEAIVSPGAVSSLRVLDDGTRVIDTDAVASPPLSGAPLFNAEGEVVGVVTYTSAGAEGFIFATPSRHVRALQNTEQLMSLDEFARELRKTNSPLFDGTDATTLTGTWHSLTSNTRKELRQDGEFLTGNYSNDADYVNYHLALQEDGHYRGHVKATLTVNRHGDSWRTWETLVCTFETKITLRAVTHNRIEGRIHDYEAPERDEGSAQQDTCLGSRPLMWIDFVWIRAE